LSSGAGLEAFRGIIEEQGGDPRVIDDYALLPHARTRAVISAPADGFIAGLDAEAIGRAGVSLGAGRERVDSVIDHGVSIQVNAAPGDRVKRGDPVLTVMYNDASRWDAARVLLESSVSVDDAPPVVVPLVREVIGGRR
jgi:pyrimidine-nucleoside phosphorylase